jgi:uncharacterized protein YbjQ (UPF0145 family)
VTEPEPARAVDRVMESEAQSALVRSIYAIYCAALTALERGAREAHDKALGMVRDRLRALARDLDAEAALEMRAAAQAHEKPTQPHGVQRWKP